MDPFVVPRPGDVCLRVLNRICAWRVPACTGVVTAVIQRGRRVTAS